MIRRVTGRGTAGDAVLGCLVVAALMLVFVFVSITVMSRNEPSPYAQDAPPLPENMPISRGSTDPVPDEDISADTTASEPVQHDVPAEEPGNTQPVARDTNEDVPPEEWTDAETARYDELVEHYGEQFHSIAVGTPVELHLVNGGKIRGKVVSSRSDTVALDVGKGGTVRMPLEKLDTVSRIRFDRDAFIAYYARRQLAKERGEGQ